MKLLRSTALTLPALGMLIIGCLPWAHANDGRYEECWRIVLDNVETGRVVEKGQSANIMMFQNPFHFIHPTQPGAAETFVFCTTVPTNRKDRPRSKGVIFLGSHPLPIRHVGPSSIGHGTRAYYGAWRSQGDPRGHLELSIHFDTLAARVIMLRGRVPNRTGMLGTGVATPLEISSLPQNPPAE